MTPVVEPGVLADFGAGVLESLGVPAADARLVADSLVTAELWGHASHGMLRLPWYVERLRSGVMTPVTEPEIVLDAGGVLVLDGRQGIGQVLADAAVTAGVERARRHGISAVAVRNSNHFGTAAYFTRRAAEAGCVSILTTNASPAMAPWGGRAKAVGTNPWSIAAPAGGRGVAVLDIANTAVARGKIYLAAERGLPIPEGWAAEADGTPTTDAAKAVGGLILPMAGHKGYAISFMMDVLSGVLTGAEFGTGVHGPYQPDQVSGCGHLAITIDIATMLAPEEFDARMERLIDEVTSVPAAAGVERIYFPGEIEALSRADKETHGVELAQHTWESLAILGRACGVPLPGLKGANA